VSNVRPSGRNRSRNDVTNIRPRSRTFRSVANYWDATNAVLKAYGRYSKLVSSCQSSNHTRSSRLLCFSGHCKAPIPFWKGIRTLLVFATICDRSSHCMMRWIGSPHHVKNVHAMRLSCGGATRRLIATNCEKGLVSFSLLFGEGYRMWARVRVRSVWRCHQKSAVIQAELTGTRSRFVSCVQLLGSIAAVAAIGSAECCYHMKEVDDAQDASDHDGR
jgi:hypothetical protein